MEPLLLPMTIGTTVCAGAGQVFVDLEKSAVAVIKATGNEASKTVGHK